LDFDAAIPKSPQNRDFTDLIEMYLNPNSAFNQYAQHIFGKNPLDEIPDFKHFMNDSLMDLVKGQYTVVSRVM
jgi:hypothetical protein